MACEELDKAKGGVGDQRYAVVHLHGDVAQVQPLCDPMTSECDSTGVRVDLEVGIGGGCDSFLNIDSSIDRENRTIHIRALGLQNITPDQLCTMEYKYLKHSISAPDLVPPFTVVYEGTLWITFVEDHDTWSNSQMVN